MNEVQFARAHGYSDDGDVLGHIHAGLRSASQTKTHQRFSERQLESLLESRERGKRHYRQAIASGEIRAPKPLSISERCEVNVDSEPTQAARRLAQKIANRRIRGAT